MDVDIVETREQRRARYSRMAIAAAVAAARTPAPEVRKAYLLIAESWSNLAKRENPDADMHAHDPDPDLISEVSEPATGFTADFEYEAAPESRDLP